MTTTEWWAQVTYPPVETDDDTLAAAIAGTPGFTIITTTPTGVRIEATVEADNLAHAAGEAMNAAATVAWRLGADPHPTELRVITAEQRDDEIARPSPIDLVGVSEIADALGVTRQRAGNITELADFPQPVGTARGGRYWIRESVDKFNERWQRKPGRPEKQH